MLAPMKRLWIRVPNLPARPLDEHHPTLTLGRAQDNDLVVDEASISRRHVLIMLRAGSVILQDLGSLNGTLVNGEPIHSPVLVDSTDVIQVGQVPLVLEEGQDLELDIEEDAGSFPLEASQRLAAGEVLGKSSHLGAVPPEAVSMLRDVSLLLVQNLPVETMLAGLLDRAFEVLRPARGAVLLRTEQGGLQQLAGRAGNRGEAPLRLSRAMMKAALDQGEAMRVDRPNQDARVPASFSMVLSGLSSLMTVPLAHGGEVVGLLYLDRGVGQPAFTEQELALAVILGNLAAARIQAMGQARILAERQAQNHESALAQTLQLRLLPQRRTVDEARFQLAAHLRPCPEVGGDFFDYALQGDRLYLCMGDVSGKGLHAAADMGLVKAYLRAHASRSESPAELLASVNARVLEEGEAELLVRAFVAFLDLRHGRLSYSSAAHEQPLKVSLGKTIQPLELRQGPTLGVQPGAEFALQFATLEPGEGLVMPSDGLVESVNGAGMPFGRLQLRRILQAAGTTDPNRLAKAVLDSLDTYCGPAPQTDDIALLAVKVVA